MIAAKGWAGLLNIDYYYFVFFHMGSYVSESNDLLGKVLLHFSQYYFFVLL